MASPSDTANDTGSEVAMASPSNTANDTALEATLADYRALALGNVTELLNGTSSNNSQRTPTSSGRSI